MWVKKGGRKINFILVNKANTLKPSEGKMCRVYNTVGSLTTLKSHLAISEIHDFKSLREVMEFQKSYAGIRQQLISHHENLIEQEKNKLQADLQKLETEIENSKSNIEQRLLAEINDLKHELDLLNTTVPKNLIKRLTKKITEKSYKRKIKHKEQNFTAEVSTIIDWLVSHYQNRKNRYEFIVSQFTDAVNQSALTPLAELERKKVILEKLNSYVYGALGEQKVVKALEVLSDEHYLINDFSVSFSPALFNKKENDYIQSVQIDHILVAPSGVFLIETKNWSEKSLENLSLRSPVDQIKRANFALYKLLNTGIGINRLNLEDHHWGDKQIPIKNLIVLTNTKPKGEFQYVKVLTLNELVNFINYFKPVFSYSETKKIAEFLLAANDQTSL